MNNGDIDTFVKDTHYVNNTRAAVQRILISKDVTKGLKSIFYELKDRESRNALPDEIYLHGINADHISITRENRAYTKEYLKKRENQYNPDMKAPTLTGTTLKEFDLDFTAAVRRQNAIIGTPLD